MDTVAKCVCPQCGKLNFVELGDFEDDEYVDEDGCEIWVVDGKKQL
jgi:lysyl-tRNA synthetase class I